MTWRNTPPPPTQQNAGSSNASFPCISFCEVPLTARGRKKYGATINVPTNDVPSLLVSVHLCLLLCFQQLAMQVSKNSK